jgi:Adenylate and Guanylate cyclase catalytic domain
MLLETVYGKFDEAAERRRIFKVETVGDCYVAGKKFVQNRIYPTKA